MFKSNLTKYLFKSLFYSILSNFDSLFDIDDFGDTIS